MAGFGFGWAPYVPVARRRSNAARLVASLRKQGREVAPVVIEGRQIARTFWGRAWCDNLKTYSDRANRLPRGRTYVRHGSVVDLQIGEGRVAALVSGSDVYEVEVRVTPVPAERWEEVARRCAGRIDSVVELLSGRLSKPVMEVLASREGGLFPGARELTSRCSCPDGARLCKHIAAVLYGVGARLDDAPDLLFLLRSVDAADLTAEAESAGAFGPAEPAHGDALAEDGLAELFGIELDVSDAEGAAAPDVEGAPEPADPPTPASPAAAPQERPADPPRTSSPAEPLLAVLTRPTLLRLCAAFDVALAPGYQRRSALEEGLRGEPQATADAVLARLKRTELQRACAKLDLSTRGRRKAELAGRVRAALRG